MADKIDVKLRVYDQLCDSYRAIDDFRSKLLGFLPLVSGSGLFLLLQDSFTDATKRNVSLSLLAPIGWFGFVITLGLFLYEIYGIRKCHALIEAGKQLECSLKIPNGQFRRRPRSVLYLINEPLAAGVIYPAVLAAWLFLAQIQPDQASGLHKLRAPLSPIVVFVGGFAATLIYNVVIGRGRPRLLYELFLGKRADQPSDCQ